MNTENISIEELAAAAQRGNMEVMPLLWEKTERLIKMLILKAINKRILPNYIDESDVLQCGYFALLAAVRAFKSNGLKFTSYLTYSVQNAVNECINGGSRRQSKIKEVSYHQPVKDRSGEDLELLELIEDKGAEYEVYEPLELTETQRIVIEAVDALPQRQLEVIRLHYFQDMSLKDIAAEQDCCVSNIQQIERQAFRELRKNKKLRALYDHIGAIDFIRGVDDYHTSPEYFNAIRAAHNLENETFENKTNFCHRKQWRRCQSRKSNTFCTTPHDQSRHLQRHTVQGYYFFTLFQITRGCSIKNYILRNVCVYLRAFRCRAVSGTAPKRQGGTMPLYYLSSL